MKSSDDITGQTFDVFQARRKISSGSFGTVYFGINTQTNEQVAIKVEKIVDEDLRSVLKEAKFLKSLEGIKGIPMVLYSGSKADLDIMVLSLLAKDLVTYMKIYKRFSLKTGLMIFEQGLSILENIHSRNIVHRDIKPENILMGREKDAETVYFVDFGISKFYKDNFGRHIPFMENKAFIGTTRYASVAAHNGQEISRKDDLESLAYVFIYLVMGQLPWQNLNVKEDEKVKKVGEMKMKMTPEELCKGLPEEILKYLIYIKTLGFRDTPEYNYLKGLIMKAIVGNNFINDCKFDWTVFPKSENKKEEEAKKNEKKKKEFLPLTTKSQVRGSLRSEEIIFNNLMVPTPDIFKDNNGSSYLSSNVGSSVCMQYEKTESIKKKKNATTFFFDETENNEFGEYNLRALVTQLEENKVKSHFFKF